MGPATRRFRLLEIVQQLPFLGSAFDLKTIEPLNDVPVRATCTQNWTMVFLAIDFALVTLTGLLAVWKMKPRAAARARCSQVHKS